MVWILLFVFFTLLLIGAAIVRPSVENPDTGKTYGIFYPFLVVYIIGFIVSTLFFSIHIVDTRNVGVVKTLGSITGQVGEGVQFTFPWQTVEEWNIRTQVIESDDTCANGTQRCMNAGSIDIQDVYVNGALNMSVDTSDVQSLAREIGPNYTNTIVRNRLEQVVKATISEYDSSVILAKREEIRAKIRDRLREELGEYSINVDDFLITNLDFTEGFRASIEAKVKATQDALTEQNKVAISQAQAQQAVEVARGQAETNRLVSQSLTPELLQFQMIQRFADNIQFYGFPTGSTPLFNLPTAAPRP